MQNALTLETIFITALIPFALYAFNRGVFYLFFFQLRTLRTCLRVQIPEEHSVSEEVGFAYFSLDPSDVGGWSLTVNVPLSARIHPRLPSFTINELVESAPQAWFLTMWYAPLSLLLHLLALVVSLGLVIFTVLGAWEQWVFAKEVIVASLAVMVVVGGAAFLMRSYCFAVVQRLGHHGDPRIQF